MRYSFFLTPLIFTTLVSFLLIAWDAVMREMPVTTGRIQFYSGQ